MCQNPGFVASPPWPRGCRRRWLPQSCARLSPAFSTGRPQVCEANSMVKGRERFLIFVESVHPLAKEIFVRETVFEQIASDCRKPEPDPFPAWGAGKRAARPRHLVLAQIGHDKFLAVKFVSSLHACGKHRMALRRIAANDQHKACVFDIVNGGRNRHRSRRCETGPWWPARLANSGEQLSMLFVPITARASFCIR